MYKIRGTDEKEYGPVSAEQVRQWIAEGRANSQTFVQGPESTEWKPLGLFPEFAGAFAAAPSTMPGVSPAVPQGGAPPAKVPNYLVQAILVTLCCCLPLGIPAIIFAAQVNSKLALGDMAGALEASRKAKMWCWIAFAVGIPLNILLLILQITAGAFEGLSRQ
jgi:hypothetical protein